MTGNKRVVLRVVLMVLMALPGYGADFGATVSLEPEYESVASGVSAREGFSLAGNLRPWVSGIVREGLFYHLSARVQMEYAGEEFKEPPLFEVERTELTWRPFTATLLTLGRQRFQDVTGMAASGLFDGLHGSAGFGWGRLSLGVYYTGLLYKETAEILMTAGDIEHYSKELDYADGDSYFASRRILAALTGEFPDLTRRSSLALTALAQFDVNPAGGAGKLHSQYLLGRYTCRPIEMLALYVSGGLDLAEAEGTALQAAFAAALGADWEPPSSIPDMLSVEGRWSSGAVNETVGPFRPISGIAQGSVFTPRLTALARVTGSYTARLFETLSAEAGLRYFIRTDVETYADADLDPESSSRLLGGEVYGSAVWAVESGLRCTLGGGVFLPGTGRAFREDAPVRWKVTGGVVLSF